MTTIRTSAETNKEERFKGVVETLGIFLVAVVLFVLFSLLTSRFSSQNNLFNIIKQVSIVAILSIGMSCVFQLAEWISLWVLTCF